MYTNGYFAPWNQGEYSFYSPLDRISYTGSYSVTTAELTIAGTAPIGWDVLNDAGEEVAGMTFDFVSTTNYPSSISLSCLSGPIEPSDWDQRVNYLLPAKCSGGGGFNVSAANGFRASFALSQPQVWSTLPTLLLLIPTNITATLVSNTPPSVVVHPQNSVTKAHGHAGFEVSASGVMPFYYQWFFEGNEISGATSSRLVVSNVGPAHLGNYSVRITNIFGSATSSNAALFMPPFIAAPFSGAVTFWGKEATWGVGIWGTEPIAYQWFHDGVAIAGATNAIYHSPNIKLSDAGLYWVVASNEFGSVTNQPAQVIVNPAMMSVGLYPGVTIGGEVGYTFTVQSSTNLTDTNAWHTMTNITLEQPVQLWLDTNANAMQPGNPMRFYQILPVQ